MKQNKKYTYKVDWANWLKQVTEHPNDFTKDEIASVKDHDPLGDNRNLIDFIKGKKVNKFIMLNE